MKRRMSIACLLLGALLLFYWQTTQGAKPKDEMLELYGLFVDAVEKVEANYVRPVSRKALLESALEGMLQNLDPHSTYINTGEWKQFRKQMEGKFGGIGIQIGVDPDSNRLRVIAPMVGTPAYEAGIVAGDEIIEIDGESAEGMNERKAVESLTGRPGTEVKITVIHEGQEEPETVTITRALIDLPSVLGDHRKPDDQWDFMLDKDKKIAYIRITSFIQDTADDLRKVLTQLKQDGMKGLILDLRDDPGGLLSAAVEVVDMFVDKGEIVSTKGRNTQPKTYFAQADAAFEDVPMVVMINQNSASASEIVSAALQDHHRALVVGQRSYGKGSVQNIIDLQDGNSVLKLTVASYYRPSGENIHRFRNAKPADKWGVSPDKGLEVKLAPNDYFNWFVGRRDRDLAAGHRKMIAGKVPAADEPKVKADNAKPKTDDAKPKEKQQDGAAAKPADAKPADSKAKEKAEVKKDAPKAQTRRTPHTSTLPFVDKQLEKALEVLRGKVNSQAKAA
jgi:carboxyl-terminal processing protease